MKPRCETFVAVLVFALSAFAVAATAGAVTFDQTGYDPACGVTVRAADSKLTATWPIAGGDVGEVVLNLDPKAPLIESLTDRRPDDTNNLPLLGGVDPTYFLTVGTRDLSLPSGWVAFFDDPPKRPHQTYRANRSTGSVKIVSQGHRCTIVLDGLSAGPFRGDLQFTFYPGTRLVHVEAVLATDQDSCAILYDTGLVGPASQWNHFSFLDSHDKWKHLPADAKATPDAVRNRTTIADSDRGCVAVFPPPHQYFYPLDFVDNYGFAWHGKGYGGSGDEIGFGIRQPLDGDQRHVPWINAPPHTRQRLGAFYLLGRGAAEQTLDEVKKFTRGDTFKHLDGYQTFTSHYHIEHTLDFMDQQRRLMTTEVPPSLVEPAFAKRFKAMGVDIAHLAEFHMGWSKEQTAHRLEFLKTMHDECRRLSGEQFLLLPGEEPDVHLGGHWLSLFSKPTYWTLQREKSQPFVEQVPGFGTVYHTGDAADVLKMMEAEKGLMWTAHARIKGSFGFPDVYKSRDYFHTDRFLGAAWKAMPADNSLPRLGTRVLDLMDDMANWGEHKVVIGEVDAFKVHADSELYGHVNINYLKLDKIPRFDDGWQPVLDALRGGKLFVTTGEVLVPTCTFDGKTGGETVTLQNGKATIEASLEWTFPLAFAEVISGDGQAVFRQRIELNDTDAFGMRVIKLPIDLAGRKWVRFEVWDVATNGAFTEPVWIK